MRRKAATPAPARGGGRRKGSGRRADASAPWELRAIQALGDGSRWSIVRYISANESPLGEIARAVGLSVACTSKHVSILREAGLVRVEKRGRLAVCHLPDEGTAAADFLRAVGIVGHDAPRGAPGGGTSGIPEFEEAGPRPSVRYQSNELEDYLL